MLGYLKKFNELPAALKRQVSSKAAMAAIEELEKKYNLPLAALIMKVMVREVALEDLAGYLAGENLSGEEAKSLAGELKEKIFSSLNEYPAANISQPIEAEEEVKFEVKPPFNLEFQAAEPLVKGASFFFSPDDEAEIRELAKSIGLVEKVELSAAATEEKLKEITSQAKINFGSADLADRFSQILRTYFRGIRNRPEAKATLIKPLATGGLNFDEDSAEQVMNMADKIVHPVKSQSEIGTQSLFNEVNSKPDETMKPLPKIKLPELEKAAEAPAPAKPASTVRPGETSAGLGESKPARQVGGQAIGRDAAYDFSKLAQKDAGAASVKSVLPKENLKSLDTAHELAPLTPAVAPSSQASRKNITPDKEKGPEARRPAAEKKPEPTPTVDRRPLIRRRFEAENLSQSQKVKVEDVKYVPRVMGPLDELRYMDLINFRRLDKAPSAAAEKIKNKISLLEEEGYAKKLEGIKAWRSSPINKLYLAIGHLSISGNKPIDVIIEERKAKGEDYLADEEFKVIMDLNKGLRF